MGVNSEEKASFFFARFLHNAIPFSREKGIAAGRHLKKESKLSFCSVSTAVQSVFFCRRTIPFCLVLVGGLVFCENGANIEV